MPHRFELLHLSELLLQIPTRRHVGLNAHEVREATSRIVDRGNREFIPESCSILSAVEQLDGARLPKPDRITQAHDRRGIGIGTLEKAAVQANRIARFVAGDALEPRADVDDRIVGQIRVGDDDALTRRSDGPVAQIELALRPFSLGDVADVALYDADPPDVVCVADELDIDLAAILGPEREVVVLDVTILLKCVERFFIRLDVLEQADLPEFPPDQFVTCVSDQHRRKGLASTTRPDTGSTIRIPSMAASNRRR